MRNPPATKYVAHIAQAAKSFDAIHTAYEDAGWTIQDEHEKKIDLLETMPEEIQQQLQLRMGFPEPYAGFRDMLTSTADNISYQDGITSSVSGLHAVESQDHSQEPVC